MLRSELPVEQVETRVAERLVAPHWSGVAGGARDRTREHEHRGGDAPYGSGKAWRATGPVVRR